MNRYPKRQSIFFLLLGLGALNLLFFNNCSAYQGAQEFPFSTSSGVLFSSSVELNVCDDELIPVFENTYHPFLRANCVLCHNAGGIGNGDFAQSDAVLSYVEFMKKPPNKVNEMATSTSHYFDPSNVPNHQAELDSITPTWNTALADYNACLSSLSSQE